MLILRPGISSFGTQDQVAFALFKKAIFAASSSVGASVVNAVGGNNITPNFHQAEILFHGNTFSVLCNRTFPIIAFVKYPIENYDPQPFDLPDFAEPMRDLGFEIATAAELDRPIEASDLQFLNEDEVKQVRYWKPKRIAEIVFNWWD